MDQPPKIRIVGFEFSDDDYSDEQMQADYDLAQELKTPLPKAEAKE